MHLCLAKLPRSQWFVQSVTTAMESKEQINKQSSITESEAAVAEADDKLNSEVELIDPKINICYSKITCNFGLE